MKLAMIIDHFDPAVHGSHDYYLCRYLTEAGHDVTLFTSTSPMLWGAVTKEYLRTRFKPGKYRVDGFNVVRLPSFVEFSFVPLMPKLYSELKKAKFDIIHSHEYFTFSS